MNEDSAADVSTDQIKMAANILRRRTEWQTLADHLPDSLLIADSDGRIVMVNSQTISLVDYSRDELLGKKVEDLMPERFRQAHATKHRPAFSDDPKPRMMGENLDLFVLTKHGREIAVEISLSKMVEAEGPFVVVTIRKKRSASRGVFHKLME